MTAELQKKVDRAVRLIRTAAKDDVVEVSYSGGKDSDVVLELTRMAGIKYRAIYKNTTIDPPGTIAHCQRNGVEIMRPTISFLNLVRKKGLPTRRVRFCCEKLKEYKVLDKAIQGIRRDESPERSNRYSESDPVICRIYNDNKKNHVSVILPILGWTLRDVVEFIAERGIKCHPHYYDEQGRFYPERRLGCIGCPMKHDAGRAEYRQYPRLFRQVVKAAKQWWDENPQTKAHQYYPNIYALVANNLFYSSYEEWRMKDQGLFGHVDWKAELERYFSINL